MGIIGKGYKMSIDIYKSSFIRFKIDIHPRVIIFWVLFYSIVIDFNNHDFMLPDD